MLLRILPTCYQQLLQNVHIFKHILSSKTKLKNKHQYTLQKWEIIFGRKMCLIFTMSLENMAYFLHAFVILRWNTTLFVILHGDSLCGCCLSSFELLAESFRSLNSGLFQPGKINSCGCHGTMANLSRSEREWKKESWPASLSVGSSIFAHRAADVKTLYEQRLKTNTLLWSWSRGLSVGWRLLVEKAVG